MQQAWTGRDARWLQWAMLGVGAAVVIVALWWIHRALQGGSDAMPPAAAHIVVAVMAVLCVGVVIGVIIAVVHFAPITVTVGDDGVRIQQGQRDDHIDFGDVVAITELPQTVSSGIGLQIYPKPEYLTRVGSHDNPERPSRRWAITGMSFSDAQLRQIIGAMRPALKRAGGDWYVAR